MQDQAGEVKRLQDALAALTGEERSTAAAGQTIGQAIGASVTDAKAKVLQATAELNAARQAALSSTIDQSETALARVNQATQAQQMALQQQAQTKALQQQVAGDQPEEMGMGTVGGRTGLLALAGGGGARAGRLYAGLSGQYGTLGAVGAGISVGVGAAGMLGKGIEAVDNSSLSTEDKIKSVTSGIPIISQLTEAFFGFKNSIAGVAQSVREADAAFAAFQITNKAMTATFTANQKYNAEESKLNAAVMAVGLNKFDVGTAPDPVNNPAGYAQWLKNIPALQAQTEADRANDAAAKQLQDLAYQQKGINLSLRASQNAANEMKDYQTGVMQDAGTYGTINKANYQPLMAEVTANQVVLDVENQKIALLEQEKKLREDIVNRESAGRKANIELEKNTLALMESELNVAKQQTQAMGAMTQSDLLGTRQAQQQAQEQGLDTLSDTQKGLLQKAGGGQWLQQEFLKAGQSGDNAGLINEIRSAFALTGDKFTGQSLDQLGAQQVNLQNQINIDVQLDKDELAKAMAKEVGPIIAALRIETKKQITLQKEQDQLRAEAAKNKGS